MTTRSPSLEPLAESLLDVLAKPLDAARRGALRGITKSRSLARVVGERDARVPLIATVQISVLLAITIARPLWLFVLGPLVLGVPHLASDARYLLVRRNVGRGVLAVSAVATALFLAMRGLELSHVAVPAARVEIVAAAAWITSALVFGVRARANETRSRWPFLVVPAVLALGAFGWAHAASARLVVAHAHNLVGVAAWALVFRRRRRTALLPAIALAVGIAVLGAGLTLPLTSLAGGASRFLGFDLHRIASALAPGFAPQTAVAITLVFVFAQAAHYGAWLVWIPQEELPGEGTFTFRMTGKSLLRDFGLVGVTVVVALCAIFAGAAAFDVRTAVRWYMSLGSFHAYLEVAMLAYFAARGRVRAPA